MAITKEGEVAQCAGDGVGRGRVRRKSSVRDLSTKFEQCAVAERTSTPVGSEQGKEARDASRVGGVGQRGKGGQAFTGLVSYFEQLASSDHSSQSGSASQSPGSSVKERSGRAGPITERRRSSVNIGAAISRFETPSWDKTTTSRCTARKADEYGDEVESCDAVFSPATSTPSSKVQKAKMQLYSPLTSPQAASVRAEERATASSPSDGSGGGVVATSRMRYDEYINNIRCHRADDGPSIAGRKASSPTAVGLVAERRQSFSSLDEGSQVQRRRSSSSSTPVESRSTVPSGIVGSAKRQLSLHMDVDPVELGSGETVTSPLQKSHRRRTSSSGPDLKAIPGGIAARATLQYLHKASKSSTAEQCSPELNRRKKSASSSAATAAGEPSDLNPTKDPARDALTDDKSLESSV